VHMMKKSRFNSTVKTVVGIQVMLLLSGCIVVQDSPAPGCIETIGIRPIGGCFGKTAILGLTIEPDNECLAVTANNCNGGVLEVHNTCGERLILGELQVSPSESVSLDVTEEESGEYSLSQVSSNFSGYVPETYRRIEITGTLGTQEITVAFTKTAELCK